MIAARSLCLLLVAAATAGAQGLPADYARASALEKDTEGKVFRSQVNPHWSQDGNSFWYRIEIAADQWEHVQVEALTGQRKVIPRPPQEWTPARAPLGQPHPSRDGGEKTRLHFQNHTASPVELLWIDPTGRRKKYGSIPAAGARVQDTYAGHVWLAQDGGGRTLGAWEAGGEEQAAVIGEAPAAVAPPAPAPRQPEPEWQPFVQDNNIWMKPRGPGRPVQLSFDGHEGNAYGEPLLLSPDGAKLAVLQVEPPQEHKVWLIESSPKDQVQPRLTSYEYLKPGDRIAHPRVRLFDLAAWQPLAVRDDLFPNPWALTEFHWLPDSSQFAFLYNERGHQLLRLVAVDAATGRAGALFEERSSTFIDYSQKTALHWLDATHEAIWMSERDGWNHLWLYDTVTGRVKQQITHGDWVVRGIERVDEARREVWFRAAGLRPEEDPYQVHLARIGFDGQGLTILTAGDGDHASPRAQGAKAGWRFSPDGRFLLDTYSRVDLPPVTELRRSSDGGLVCTVEHADADALLATGWRPPERFSAKGRDGRTDIFGIIIRPSNFDPARKYPVLEDIYAGPHGFFVPKDWGLGLRQRRLAELGFIVVQIDGMGTNWRSRAFHDVCWKNLCDAGFPDRIAWLRAAAGSVCPQMDLSRVGIFGGSAGGQSALAALLHHGNFYRAAAADCGCHDNRMDKIWWNEAWMGWPVGPEYGENSNVTHAGLLTGKLLLTVGELDHNVDPASTMQVANALLAAGKDFEMVVVPGAGHGAGEQPAMVRRRMDFFVRHLLGVGPPS